MNILNSSSEGLESAEGDASVEELKKLTEYFMKSGNISAADIKAAAAAFSSGGSSDSKSGLEGSFESGFGQDSSEDELFDDDDSAPAAPFGFDFSRNVDRSEGSFSINIPDFNVFSGREQGPQCQLSALELMAEQNRKAVRSEKSSAMNRVCSVPVSDAGCIDEAEGVLGVNAGDGKAGSKISEDGDGSTSPEECINELAAVSGGTEQAECGDESFKYIDAAGGEDDYSAGTCVSSAVCEDKELSCDEDSADASADDPAGDEEDTGCTDKDDGSDEDDDFLIRDDSSGDSENDDGGVNLDDVMTPRQIVEALDRFIIGQEEAKRAVAVSLRSRSRRECLPAELREEIIPKNILMIGPTGVGKTEIARRLARLAEAPFLKVEATKYTEVGYVGRDAESMIRDLAEAGFRIAERRFTAKVEGKAKDAAVERLLDFIMYGPDKRPASDLMQRLAAAAEGRVLEKKSPEKSRPETSQRRALRRSLLKGELDNLYIEINLEDDSAQEIRVGMAGFDDGAIDLENIVSGFLPKAPVKRRVSVARALELLTSEEARKLVDPEEIKRFAVRIVENEGIIFLDELDKIAGSSGGHGPDVSREGVQRDILPIIEGSAVRTKIGIVKTDHILFIGAGAFSISKPSDLLPELQGRFPIRVTLNSLKKEDFERILVEPDNSLIKQYRALLSAEGVDIEFTDGAIAELAETACLVNDTEENIGARRLHTLLEKVLEEISFEAPERRGSKFVIDKAYVSEKLKETADRKDLSKFIL